MRPNTSQPQSSKTLLVPDEGSVDVVNTAEEVDPGRWQTGPLSSSAWGRQYCGWWGRDRRWGWRVSPQYARLWRRSCSRSPEYLRRWWRALLQSEGRKKSIDHHTIDLGEDLHQTAENPEPWLAQLEGPGRGLSTPRPAGSSPPPSLPPPPRRESTPRSYLRSLAPDRSAVHVHPVECCYYCIVKQ